MPVVAVSLVNYAQTISGQTIPAHGRRVYAGPTSALTTAQTNGTVKLTEYADPSSASNPYTAEGAAGKEQYIVPLATETHTINDDVEQLILKPAGTLATLTVNMPANPYDGQRVGIASTQAVTTLTMSGNGKTLNNGLAALTAGGFGSWRYRAADTSWYRVS